MSRIPLRKVTESDLLGGDLLPSEIYEIAIFHNLNSSSFVYDDDTCDWLYLGSATNKTVHQLWVELIDS